MMSDDDMDALEKASAEDAGKLYLEQMVQHHTSAVDMAKTRSRQGQEHRRGRPGEIDRSSQTEQITQMKDLLLVDVTMARAAATPFTARPRPLPRLALQSKRALVAARSAARRVRDRREVRA